jgi:hypothetical protein
MGPNDYECNKTIHHDSTRVTCERLIANRLLEIFVSDRPHVRLV